MGGLFEENLSKTEGNRRTRPAFLHNILKFLTRVEGGIGGPNTPVSALGSPVNFTPNLSDKNSNYYSCRFYDYFYMNGTGRRLF